MITSQFLIFFRPRHPQKLANPSYALLAFVLIWSFSLIPVSAQKLPSAEKVVDSYLKAIGGKKRLTGIRDATHEWTIQFNDRPMGLAQTHLKWPASVRSEMTFGNGRVVSAANMRSAWSLGLDGKLYTLTDDEAAAARLQALLDATHLVDFKKRNVLAKVVSIRNVGSEPAYVVEFSLRSGARLKYLFSTSSKLLLVIEDDARKTTTKFEDYRAEQNILQPHRFRSSNSDAGELTFTLQKAHYNSGLAEATFDPPRAEEALDIVTLLREVSRNQNQLEKRFHEYSFIQKETDREINGKGELKKETSKVYEVFPLPNREPVMKLLSENGVPLTGARAASEQKRIEAEFLKAERDKEKDQSKADQRSAERRRKAPRKDDDEDLDISAFLRIHDFVSPRREKFRDRDAVVFDFRPRPGFKSSNRMEDLVSKLVGVVWIDPVDKQIMRLEARLAEGFKMAGGLLLSLRPGAAVVMEQKRMDQAIWLPRFVQMNMSVKFLLFGGGDWNKTIEWSDYKHFAGDVGDYKLDAPKTESATTPSKP